MTAPTPSPGLLSRLQVRLGELRSQINQRMVWQRADPEFEALLEERRDYGPFGKLGPDTARAVKTGVVAAGRAAIAPFGVLITITVGDRFIRVLVTRGNRVRRWAEADLPAGIVQDGLIVDETAFSDALGVVVAQVRKGPRMNGQRLAVAITGRNVVQRRFTLFITDEMDVAEEIIKASSEKMSIRPEELQLDWDVAPAEIPEGVADADDGNIETGLEDGPEGEPHDVYAFGVYRNVVETNLRTLSGAGVRFAGLQPKAMALAAATNSFTGVVLDVEANSLTAIVLRDGLPEVVRELGVDDRLNTAQWVQVVTTQVSRTVAFHDSLYPDTPLGNDAPLFVTGAGKSDAGLATNALELLPFPVVELPPTLRAPQEFPFARFAANVGLSLLSGKRFWQRTAIPLIPRAKLDFLPLEYQPRPFPVRTVLTATMAAGLILGLGGVFQLTSDQMARAAYAEETLASLDARVRLRDIRSQEITNTRADLEALQDETRHLIASSAVIKGLDRGFAGVIATLSSLAPEGVTLESMDDDGRLITLTASGDSYDSLLMYVVRLENESSFDGVRVRSIGTSAAVDAASTDDLLSDIPGTPETPDVAGDAELADGRASMSLEVTRAVVEEDTSPDDRAAQSTGE
ncbi:MAG: PilN domain-containing protein [Dehalococcoidia bacterium]